MLSPTSNTSSLSSTAALHPSARSKLSQTFNCSISCQVESVNDYIEAQKAQFYDNFPRPTPVSKCPEMDIAEGEAKLLNQSLCSPSPRPRLPSADDIRPADESFALEHLAIFDSSSECSEESERSASEASFRDHANYKWLDSLSSVLFLESKSSSRDSRQPRAPEMEGAGAEDRRYMICPPDSLEFYARKGY